MKTVLNAQQPHWDHMYITHAEMFGELPSDAARQAVTLFTAQGQTTILELGGGQGRDTIFLAQNGLQVTTLDYAATGMAAINQKARRLGLSHAVTALCHDVRHPLPFDDASFDGCYSHMLYCMALTTTELARLAQEVRRVLKPGGIQIYTVRNIYDAHYQTGIHRGEDMYEVGGFIVHFFSLEKVARLAAGYEIVRIDAFEEGDLPRKLWCVTLKKT